MSKRARITRGQSSSSQGVSIEEKVRMLRVFESGVHQMRHDALSRCHIHSEDIIDWDFLASQVREFFGSFEFDSSPCRYDPNHLGVRFRLGGEQKEISLLELGWRIGLYSERQSRESATLSGLRKGVIVKANHLLLGFWPTIGDDGFNVGNTKVAAIRDPRVKIAHRRIATTIVGMFVTWIAQSYGFLTNEMMGELSVKPSPHVFKKKSLISMGVVMKLHNEGCFWPAAREAIEEDKEDDEGNEVAGGGAGHEGAGGSTNMYRNISQGDWQVHQTR
ncbi:hypothetical protein Tco_0726572 [Tanacetum coccineum]|uniref:Uncharacterized protein n=1 Tax=Tanacetum coccineum TaxID=301880 RepID=A0ABQ4YH14_9ASTR